MSGLEVALVMALLVTVGSLPAGIWRTLAYRSGDIAADHTPTMRTAAAVALTIGVLGLAASVVLLVLVVTR